MKSISVKKAAQISGLTEQCIRIGLQRGILKFGAAIKQTGNRYNYIIYPKEFYDTFGVREEDRV